MESPNPALTVRAFEPADLPAALAIQAEAYPAFLREDEAAFASRLGLAASYCRAAVRDGALVAYLLAHGWSRESPPPVGMVLADRPGDVLFLHDLAVSSAARGSGIGRILVTQALDAAARDGLARAELIAVEGAAGYWRALGFAETEASPPLVAKVAAYGLQARWMTRAL